VKFAGRQHVANDRLNQGIKQSRGLAHPLRLRGHGDVHALTGIDLILSVL
jgi:hypothetical protein